MLYITYLLHIFNTWLNCFYCNFFLSCKIYIAEFIILILFEWLIQLSTFTRLCSRRPVRFQSISRHLTQKRHPLNNNCHIRPHVLSHHDVMILYGWLSVYHLHY